MLARSKGGRLEAGRGKSAPPTQPRTALTLTAHLKVDCILAAAQGPLLLGQHPLKQAPLLVPVAAVNVPAA